MTGGQSWSGDRIKETIQKEQVMEKVDKIKVTVVDIKMPFSSMVLFMVKLALASIPAMTLLLILGFFFFGLAARLLPSMCIFLIRNMIWG
jgi:hypothetical protein